MPFEDNIPAVNFYAATLAIIQGLLDQGAADREKLVAFVERLIDGLSPEDKETTYGVALRQAMSAFERGGLFPRTGEGRH